MRVLSIVHERAAGSGVFAAVARERGDELVEWIPALQPRPRGGEFHAALVFGGATHADEDEEHDWLQDEKLILSGLLSAATPALGVCLGAQLLAEVAGGRVLRMSRPEIGWTTVALAEEAREDLLLGLLPPRFQGFQWHSYEISPPVDAVPLARSPACLQAFRLASAPWWGIQFHAEATGETIAGWIDDYRSDPDAVAAGLDWRALASETAREIARSNELGREICARFLARAQALGNVGGALPGGSP